MKDGHKPAWSDSAAAEAANSISKKRGELNLPSEGKDVNQSTSGGAELPKNYGTARDEKRTLLYEVVPMQIPFTVGISPGNVCNFKCRYCRQSVEQRQKSILSWDDYLKIVTQIKEMCEEYGRLKKISIAGHGEPLLNSRLPDMVKHMTDLGISDCIELTTNASLLTHEKSRQLIDAGLTRLKISIQGVDAAGYKRNCGADVDINMLLENIAYFYNNRKECKVYIKTIDTLLKDGENKVFYELFSPVCDTIGIEHELPFYESVNYSHLDKTTHQFGGMIEKEVMCCAQLFYFANIDESGDVSSCCGTPALVYGNTHESPLKDIWLGSMHKAFMTHHLRGQRGLHKECKNCAQLSLCCWPEDNIDDHAGEILDRLIKI